jgi:homoserine kinase type II
VTGLIDFGALAIDSFATDIARLIGSLVGADPAAREQASAAYEQVRPLTATEHSLVRAFDASSVLLSPLNWFAWNYFEHRVFADRSTIITRVDEQLAQLEQLAARGSPWEC